MPLEGVVSLQVLFASVFSHGDLANGQAHSRKTVVLCAVAVQVCKICQPFAIQPPCSVDVLKHATQNAFAASSRRQGTSNIKT